MLLFPNKYKFSKSFSGQKITGSVKKQTSRNFLFGDLALITHECGYITNFQIEASRQFLRRFLKKKSKIFFRIFPNTPISKKPNDIRLGRGKGNLKYWATYVKKGTPILEIRSYNYNLAKKILKNSQNKLPVKTFILDRHFRWIL